MKDGVTAVVLPQSVIMNTHDKLLVVQPGRNSVGKKGSPALPEEPGLEAA